MEQLIYIVEFDTKVQISLSLNVISIVNLACVVLFQ